MSARSNRWQIAGLGAAVAVLLAALVLFVAGDIVSNLHTVPPPPAPRATPAARPAPKPPVADGPFVVRSILPIPGPIKFGQFYWDETRGEPGPLVITVDLTARVLSVFEDGHEIGATAILKGYGDKPTPTACSRSPKKTPDTSLPSMTRRCLI